MKQLVYATLLFSIALAGCSSQSSTANTEGKAQAADPEENSAAQAENAAPEKSSENEGTEVALSPRNTKIQFVGNHTGDDPRPRTGTFEKFTGKAKLNKDVLTSLQVDIETSSVTTDIEKLTNHLKSPDFFDVREHPKASFQSTAIKADGKDKVNITGNLTLLGVTKPITFPATVSTQDGLSLKSAFIIDRTQFGMDYGLDNVEKDVEMTVSIGQ